MGLRTKLRKFVASKKYPLETYYPARKTVPEKLIESNTAWKGLELILEDILDRFDVGRDKCIEFGVEYCYSTVALSNYFKEVKGVDIFVGDPHSGGKADHYEDTKESVAAFPNIQLFKSDYKDWIRTDDEQYDFAHVDIVHLYDETFECGLWAIEHSKCTIFHDTESFTDVRRAVHDLAKKTGKKVYNYPFHHGLGIIV
jgi:hypothetical protein